MGKEWFGVATNLVISSLVTLYGAFAWLVSRWRDVPEGEVFRQRSYACWWASWLCWTLLWLWTGIRQSYGWTDLRAKIPDLALDNLNCIFLVLLSLVITRGNAFGKRKLLLAFLQVSGSLAVGFAILYSFSYSLGLNFSYGIHSAWSLCMSAAGPILVGWAVYLRFNSVLVLAIGFVYAFIQPVAYAFDLQSTDALSKEQIAQYQPVIDTTLGGLKILWAVIFVQILVHGKADGKSLVGETNNPGLIGKWDHRTLGHAFILGFAYLILIVSMLMTFKDQKKIEEFSVAFGIVMGFIGLLDILWRLWSDVINIRTQPELARNITDAK